MSPILSNDVFVVVYTREKGAIMKTLFLVKNFLFVYHIKKLCNEQVIITQQNIEPKKARPARLAFLYLPT